MPSPTMSPMQRNFPPYNRSFECVFQTITNMNGLDDNQAVEHSGSMHSLDSRHLDIRGCRWARDQSDRFCTMRFKRAKSLRHRLHDGSCVNHAKMVIGKQGKG